MEKARSDSPRAYAKGDGNGDKLELESGRFSSWATESGERGQITAEKEVEAKIEVKNRRCLRAILLAWTGTTSGDHQDENASRDLIWPGFAKTQRNAATTTRHNATQRNATQRN